MTFVIEPGEPFIVRVIQSANNGNTKWANTLEYIAENDVTGTVASNIAQEVKEAFRYILINQFAVEKVVISTWTPDGQPYNPSSFITFPFNESGRRGRFGEDVVDLSVCLRLDKRASSGRSGRMLLRGVLHEGMLRTVGGRFNFQAPGGLDGIDFNDGLTRIEALRNVPSAEMALVSNLGARPVSLITLAGISIKKLNNKYFDRQ